MSHHQTGVRRRAGSPRPTGGGRAGRPPPPHDRGSATVWAAAGVAVIMTVFLVGLHLGAAVIARHRAEAAADLAALAAAGVAVEGAEAACDRAGEVAAAMGGTVTSCGLVGWDALVEVRVPTEVALPGIDGAAGRARAGPVLSPSAAEPGPAPPIVENVPPNGLHMPSPISSNPASQSSGRTTSGRSTRTDGTTRRGIRHPAASDGRPTTRRTIATLVVTSIPISDDHWRRRDHDAPTGYGSRPGQSGRTHRIAPQTAVGPERRNRRPPPVSGPPRADRRRPARPPTRPAGGGLPRSPADRPAGPPISGPGRGDGGLAQRVEHDVEHPHRPRLVQRGVAVAALRRLHAGRAPGAALAVADRSAGGGQPAAQHRVPTLGEARRRQDDRRARTRWAGRCAGAAPWTCPPTSQRSQIAKSGSRPIAACSAACSAPGIRFGGTPAATSASSSTSYQTPRVRSTCSGRSSGTVASTVPSGARRRYSTTCEVTVTSPNDTRTGPRSRRVSTRATSTSALLRASVRNPGSAGRHHGDPCLEVQLLHEVGLTAVQVHRAGVHGRGGGGPVHRAEHAAGLRLHHSHLARARTPDVHGAGGALPGRGPVPAGRPAPQRTVGHELVEHGSGRGTAEHVANVALGHRQLGSGADELRAQYVGVGRVEHAPLHRGAEQRVRVVHEVGVHRIVPRHEHNERLVARPTGPSGLLPERRPGTREARHHHRVEAGDVHAELERVGGRHAEQLAARPARPRARAAPRAGSRPGRRPPAPRGPGRPRRANAAPSARPPPRHVGTARTRACAPLRAPGRRASGPPRCPPADAPARRSRR